MERRIPATLAVALLLLIAFGCEEEKKCESPEAILFNDTIQWGWPIDVWYGGNSFYWWHNISEGVTEYGELSPTDWISPCDYGHGRFYIRFEILEQPTDSAFKIQLGFWQDRDKEGGHSETIASSLYMQGGAGDLLEKDLGTPPEWWNRRDDAPVDFSRPEDMYKIGLAMWKTGEEVTCIPMGQGWSNSNACDNPEQTAAEFFPIKAWVTVVAVAEGHTFTGWENY